MAAILSRPPCVICHQWEVICDKDYEEIVKKNMERIALFLLQFSITSYGISTVSIGPIINCNKSLLWQDTTLHNIKHVAFPNQ